MAFVDDLTLILDLLVLVTVSIFYTAFLGWFHTRRKDSDRAYSHLRSGSMVLALLGATLFVVSLWGEFAWPLPGSYNLYFFDPLLMLGLILVAFGAAVWLRLPTHIVGLVALVSGSGIIYYGIRAYLIGLTKDPFETLLLYLGFGAAGILAYPTTLFVDWFVAGPKVAGADPMPAERASAYPKLWTAVLGLFLLIVVLAGIAAVIYGFTVAWTHLESPP